jgi:hypothetical protein
MGSIRFNAEIGGAQRNAEKAKPQPKLKRLKGLNELQGLEYFLAACELVGLLQCSEGKMAEAESVFEKPIH